MKQNSELRDLCPLCLCGQSFLCSLVAALPRWALRVLL